jgi:hypothetical protein
MVCVCINLENLVDITNDHKEFTNRFDCVDIGDWVRLMRCPNCGQLWKVDEWDKYQTLYAQKIFSIETWKTIDHVSLIKEQMIKNRGGIEENKCLWKECDRYAVKSCAYCVDHLYETGTRA